MRREQKPKLRNSAGVGHSQSHTPHKIITPAEPQITDTALNMQRCLHWIGELADTMVIENAQKLKGPECFPQKRRNCSKHKAREHRGAAVASCCCCTCLRAPHHWLCCSGIWPRCPGRGPALPFAIYRINGGIDEFTRNGSECGTQASGGRQPGMHACSTERCARARACACARKPGIVIQVAIMPAPSALCYATRASVKCSAPAERY